MANFGWFYGTIDSNDLFNWWYQSDNQCWEAWIMSGNDNNPSYRQPFVVLSSGKPFLCTPGAQAWRTWIYWRTVRTWCEEFCRQPLARADGFISWMQFPSCPRYTSGTADSCRVPSGQIQRTDSWNHRQQWKDCHKGMAVPAVGAGPPCHPLSAQL